MPEQATVPNAYFEVNMDYVLPSAKVLTERPKLIQAMFSAFKQWEPSIDDMEVITTGKPSEQGVKLKIPAKAVGFFVGIAACKFSRDNTSWETAEETIQILDLALSTLHSIADDVEIKTRKTMLALHVQPKTLSFVRFIDPLIAPQLTSLGEGELKTAAIVVRWGNRKITFDGSSYVANGIFVRLERDFSPDISYGEIAAQLKADEDEIIGILGLEVE
jgi:hypothetical protein